MTYTSQVLVHVSAETMQQVRYCTRALECVSSQELDTGVVDCVQTQMNANPIFVLALGVRDLTLLLNYCIPPVEYTEY